MILSIGIVRASYDSCNNALIAAHPDRTLAELKDALATPASVPTVWRAVRALGLTVKKTVRPSEHDRPAVAAARVAWHAAAPTWDVAHLVLLDETGLTTNLLRRYGRAPRAALEEREQDSASRALPYRRAARSFRQLCDSLDLIDHERRDRLIKAAGPDKRLDEPSTALRARFRMCQCVGNLADMLAQVFCHFDQPAVGSQQVVKVQCLLLAASKLFSLDREHGLAEDPCLDHRAGVESGDGRRVIQGVV